MASPATTARPWESPAWAALAAHAQRGMPPLSVLLQDAARASALVKRHGGTVLDMTRSKLTTETVALLLELARQADVPGKVRAMVAGSTDTNPTERRAVLHTALRCAPDSARFEVREAPRPLG